jgi:hypothetical protein
MIELVPSPSASCFPTGNPMPTSHRSRLILSKEESDPISKGNLMPEVTSCGRFVQIGRLIQMDSLQRCRQDMRGRSVQPCKRGFTDHGPIRTTPSAERACAERPPLLALVRAAPRWIRHARGARSPELGRRRPPRRNHRPPVIAPRRRRSAGRTGRRSVCRGRSTPLAAARRRRRCYCAAAGSRTW